MQVSIRFRGSAEEVRYDESKRVIVPIYQDADGHRLEIKSGLGGPADGFWTFKDGHSYKSPKLPRRTRLSEAVADLNAQAKAKRWVAIEMFPHPEVISFALEEGKTEALRVQDLQDKARSLPFEEYKALGLGQGELALQQTQDKAFNEYYSCFLAGLRTSKEVSDQAIASILASPLESTLEGPTGHRIGLDFIRIVGHYWLISRKDKKWGPYMAALIRRRPEFRREAYRQRKLQAVSLGIANTEQKIGVLEWTCRGETHRRFRAEVLPSSPFPRQMGDEYEEWRMGHVDRLQAEETAKRQGEMDRLRDRLKRLQALSETLTAAAVLPEYLLGADGDTGAAIQEEPAQAESPEAPVELPEAAQASEPDEVADGPSSETPAPQTGQAETVPAIPLGQVQHEPAREELTQAPTDLDRLLAREFEVCVEISNEVMRCLKARRMGKAQKTQMPNRAHIAAKFGVSAEGWKPLDVVTGKVLLLAQNDNLDAKGVFDAVKVVLHSEQAKQKAKGGQVPQQRAIRKQPPMNAMPLLSL